MNQLSSLSPYTPTAAQRDAVLREIATLEHMIAESRGCYPTASHAAIRDALRVALAVAEAQAAADFTTESAPALGVPEADLPLALIGQGDTARRILP